MPKYVVSSRFVRVKKSGLTIVIIEHAIVAQMLSSFYKKIIVGENTIIIVLSAEEAEAVIASRQVDLLIMARSIPKPDVLTFWKKVKTIHPYVKGIITSSFTDEDLKDRALKAGISAYLIKPFPIEHFSQSIVHLLEKPC